MGSKKHRRLKINPRGINHTGGVARWGKKVSEILLDNQEASLLKCPGIESKSHFVTRFSENVILPNYLKSEDFLVSLCNWGPLLKNQLLVIHDVAPIVHPEYFSKWYQLFAQVTLPRLAEKVSAISTVSEYSKQEICEKLNVPSEKVTVVGAASAINNLNLDLINSSDVMCKTAYMLFLGGHDPRKNLSFLLSLWPEIHKESGLELYITSSGDSPVFEKQILSDLPGVKLIGNPNDIQLANYIRNASCLLSPSHYEGFGMPIIEALSLGTPVIATNTGIVVEIRSKGLKVAPLESQAWKSEILNHRKIAFDFEWDSWHEVSSKIIRTIAEVS